MVRGYTEMRGWSTRGLRVNSAVNLLLPRCSDLLGKIGLAGGNYSYTQDIWKIPIDIDLVHIVP
jgi:hypothetical protein